MAKKKTSVYIDEDLLKAAKIVAIRTRKKKSQIFEDALRQYLGLAALGRIWRRGSLSEGQTLRLAYEELRAARR